MQSTAINHTRVCGLFITEIARRLYMKNWADAAEFALAAKALGRCNAEQLAAIEAYAINRGWK